MPARRTRARASKKNRRSIVSAAARFFPPEARARGFELLENGKVEVENGDHEFVQARCTDGAAAKVLIQYHRPSRTLGIFCTCGSFRACLTPCPHIWATLVEADFRELMRDARGLETVVVPGVTAGAGSGSGAGDGEAGPCEVEIECDPWDESLDEEEDEEGIDWAEDGPGREGGEAARPGSGARAAAGGWRDQLQSVRRSIRAPSGGAAGDAGEELVYVIDIDETLVHGDLTVDVGRPRRGRGGAPGRLVRAPVTPERVHLLPSAADREILSLLLGAHERYVLQGIAYRQGMGQRGPDRFRLPPAMQRALVRLMCATGRCRLRPAVGEAPTEPMAWDDGPPWELCVELRREERSGVGTLSGSLRRGDDRMPLSTPALLTAGGVVLTEGRAASLDDLGGFAWIVLLRRRKAIEIPAGDIEAVMEALFTMPRLPRLELPEALPVERITPAPRPHLVISPPRYPTGWNRLDAELAFAYDGLIVGKDDPEHGVYQRTDEGRRLVVRDEAAERAAAARLRELGFRDASPAACEEGAAFQLPARLLARVVPPLVEDGWHLEAEGKIYRRGGDLRLDVRTGIDWFELHGELRFGDQVAKLPALLEAVRRQETMVTLDDGSVGLLPEDWLRRYGLVAGLGVRDRDCLRFGRSQVGVLDVLLASRPEATCDEMFTRAREELRGFERIEPADPGAEFTGVLRDYQRDGLGWLHFLRRFGFGGCLADDMGLGKTVQVLALLEERRRLRAGAEAEPAPPPSLVVVPRSLVFNWKQETARFTPEIRVLEHIGPDRGRSPEGFADHDLIITTYGILRRDAALLGAIPFDYVVLDEAQAIKNPRTASAKAARLLHARHRLVLSGTPIENHLGELFSLFDFLNPGLLGSAAGGRVRAADLRKPDPETLDTLGQVLKPFILRRTKTQVASDLPPKTEQTVYTDLPPRQRRSYDELRGYYQSSLLKRVDREGMAKTRMHVLEALLRLRQAACHPGLLDKARTGEADAKLELLLPRLAELREEGHKALVFSQFTSLLAIVRERLDREGVNYAYLDGRSRRRERHVERFQNDPDCSLFLISLKAGGLGLNLTAAEYVFLLDPWWNPAVECQAIDRAHRIGQARAVFACRIIARDTVEERVLELQASKRKLAEAIISADNSVIANLRRADLERLLS